MPPEIFGPLGLTVALVIAVGILWRDHRATDIKRDSLIDIATAGWREQTAASSVSASAIEAIAKKLEAPKPQRRRGKCSDG